MSNYADLESHQKLMDKMEEVVNKANQMLDESQEVRTELTNHNTDATSHPDIRNMINEATGGNESLINSRITQHNEDANAHLAKFAELTKAIEDTSVTKQLIAESVNLHNTDKSAHSDIREQINKLASQIGSTNISDVTNSLSNINKKLKTVDTEISELQSVDARHDSEISANTASIEKQQEILDIHESNILNIGHTAASYMESADKHHLQTLELKIAQELGYQMYISGGPNLRTFVTTLPTYIGKNTTKEFKMSGAGDGVTYDITPGIGNLVFSKQTGIANNEKITVQVQDSAKPGDLCYFTVTAKNSGGKTVKRILAFYVTTPIDPINVTLQDLPENVEPSGQYIFHFRNIVEGNERFTYSINPGVSGLLFNKTNNIDEDEEVSMTVPSSVERNTFLEFEVIIHDIYGSDVKKTIRIYVNDLPGQEDFETNLPNVAKPGSTFTVKFAGITSVNGVPAKYSIENPTSYLTFSKTADILANENVTVTVSDAAIRGDRATFTLKTKDENGVSLEIPLGFQINQLPDASTVEASFIEETKGGVTKTLTITGGTDPEDVSNITYAIRDVNSGFGFSKTENIKAGEAIEVTIPKVAQDVTVEFGIVVVDTLQEKSTPKSVSVTVKAIYVAHTPEILYPEPNTVVDDIFTARITPYSEYVDLSTDNTAIRY